MVNEIENKSRGIFKSPIFVVLVSVVLTLVVVVGGGYLLGFHRPHGVTVVDEGTGEEKTLWTCGMHPWIMEEAPGLCPICNMDLTPMRGAGSASASDDPAERRILYWRAPMNPKEIYDEPGKSAMGMDLVPVYEDEVAGGVEITIDPVTQQNMGIRTAIVKKDELTRTIRTYGHVTYDETRLAQVNLKFSGWVEKLHVDYTGAMVERGEPLFELSSPELIAAGEEYLAALNNVKRLSSPGSSRSFLASAQRRLEYFGVPVGEIEKIAETGRVERTITIRTPFPGVVIDKNVEVGSHIKASNTTYRIADLSRVWVETHIYEYELPWVKEGQTAVMTLPYAPGRTYTGKVAYIYPYLQAQTRDVVVRLEFENPELSLKPDMYADVTIESGDIGEGLVIPSEAVIRSGERNVVFVARENNKFTPRDVTLGLSLDDRMVQVLTGLATGETVVTSAQFMLDSESKLKEAVQKMMEAKKPVEKKTESVEEDFFSDFE
jgi:Cu(I)/Ag(I) efflux system membrane fusion protein/cobalt-zinc-cadmium efflux system membrane fusion protein